MAAATVHEEAALPVFLFDADCGFCTTTASKLRTIVPDVRVEPWQAQSLGDLGLTEADVSTAAWFVDADGSTWRGHTGVAKALETRGGLFRSAAALRYPPLGWVAAPAYALIAKYRYRLPGSTDACRLPE